MSGSSSSEAWAARIDPVGNDTVIEHNNSNRDESHSEEINVDLEYCRACGVICESCHNCYPRVYQEFIKRSIDPSNVFCRSMLIMSLIVFVVLLAVTPYTESHWTSQWGETRRIDPKMYLLGPLSPSVSISSDHYRGASIYYLEGGCKKEMQQVQTTKFLDLYGSHGLTILNFKLLEEATLDIEVHAFMGTISIEIWRQFDLLMDPYNHFYTPLLSERVHHEDDRPKQFTFIAPSTDEFALLFRYDSASYGTTQIRRREEIESYPLDGYNPACMSLPGECVVRSRSDDDCILVRGNVSYGTVYVKSMRSWRRITAISVVPLLLGLVVTFVYRFNCSENLPETTATQVGESAPLLGADRMTSAVVAQALHADPPSSDVGDYQSLVVVVPDENVMVETENGRRLVAI
jgi:hypothetical protein